MIPVPSSITRTRPSVGTTCCSFSRWSPCHSSSSTIWDGFYSSSSASARPAASTMSRLLTTHSTCPCEKVVYYKNKKNKVTKALLIHSARKVVELHWRRKSVFKHRSDGTSIFPKEPVTLDIYKTRQHKNSRYCKGASHHLRSHLCCHSSPISFDLRVESHFLCK